MIDRGGVAGLPCSLPGVANRTSGWLRRALARCRLSGRRCVSRASADAANRPPFDLQEKKRGYAAPRSDQPPTPPMDDLGPPTSRAGTKPAAPLPSVIDRSRKALAVADHDLRVAAMLEFSDIGIILVA
jgi:hypothetical protein